MFLNNFFYRERFLAPRLTPKLENHASSAVHDCLFNLFAATLLIGDRSSIRNLRTRLAVVTGTHYESLRIIFKIPKFYHGVAKTIQLLPVLHSIHPDFVPSMLFPRLSRIL